MSNIDIANGLWTDDPERACRFADKYQAELCIDKKGRYAGSAVVATEHEFVNVHASAAPVIDRATFESVREACAKEVEFIYGLSNKGSTAIRALRVEDIKLKGGGNG